MESFLYAFIPMFVAIDPLGALPVFLSLTEGTTPREKKKLATQAVVTALIVGVAFGFAGRLVFSLLGITSDDFKIAGGLLLLLLSIKEISGSPQKRAELHLPEPHLGVVPIGIPLIAGPALLTTLLILHDVHSYIILLLALVANLLITYGLFLFSDKIVSRLGEATSKAMAKVIALFLAAIGVMMIRRGIESLLSK